MRVRVRAGRVPRIHLAPAHVVTSFDDPPANKNFSGDQAKRNTLTPGKRGDPHNVSMIIFPGANAGNQIEELNMARVEGSFISWNTGSVSLLRRSKIVKRIKLRLSADWRNYAQNRRSIAGAVNQHRGGGSDGCRHGLNGLNPAVLAAMSP